MKNSILEAYDFYKRQYGCGIILFHIGQEYMAFKEDAMIVANLLEPRCIELPLVDDIPAYSFNQDLLDEMVEILYGKYGISFTIIEYRDENGSYCLPKVKQILQDIEDDY